MTNPPPSNDSAKSRALLIRAATDAIARDDESDLAAALGAGLPVEERPGSGAATLAMIAAGRGSPRCLELLLSRGADARARVESSMFPDEAPEWNTQGIHAAAAHGSAPCLALLLRHGADPDQIQGYPRSTPLTLAVERGHADCVALLLAFGADPFLDVGSVGLDDRARRHYDRRIAAMIAKRRMEVAERGVLDEAAERAVTTSAGPKRV